VLRGATRTPKFAFAFPIAQSHTGRRRAPDAGQPAARRTDAGGGTRTPKDSRPPAPKAGAYTNSATPAATAAKHLSRLYGLQRGARTADSAGLHRHLPQSGQGQQQGHEGNRGRAPPRLGGVDADRDG